MLRSWFRLSEADAALALGGSYDPLPIVASTPPVSTSETPESGFDLLPVAPNPVQSRSTVRFTLANPTLADVALYDTSGRRVSTLASGSFALGTHVVQLDTHGMAAGLYVLRLQTEAGVKSQTVTVAR